MFKTILFVMLCCISLPSQAFVKMGYTKSGFKQEMTCLSDNIYFESRGEGVAGWRAVANVVMNRKRSNKFPNSVCGVVYQKTRNVCQFSWVCDSRFNNSNKSFRNTSLYKDIYNVALRAFIMHNRTSYKDNTNKSLFYHAKHINLKDLGLVKRVNNVAVIGNHVFYK